MNEARRLLEAITRIRDKAHEYGALPAEIERLADDELRKARAFLAQDTAREAVLVAALRWALSALDRGDGVLEYTGDAADGEAAQAALADTSPAAAALLAQGERLREAVTHPTYGDLFDLAKEIHERMGKGDWPRMGQMGALLDMGRRARAALAPGEETE